MNVTPPPPHPPGYIIPTPVIHHFLTDFERHGAYTGFPCLGVEWQKLENPDLRTVLKMKVGACARVRVGGGAEGAGCCAGQGFRNESPPRVYVC